MCKLTASTVCRLCESQQAVIYRNGSMERCAPIRRECKLSKNTAVINDYEGAECIIVWDNSDPVLCQECHVSAPDINRVGVVGVVVPLAVHPSRVVIYARDTLMHL